MKIQINHYTTIDSTNSALKQRALEGCQSGLIISALNQTQGRGRLGRSFSSAPGGLYISFLLDLDQSFLLTAKAAVAVSLTLDSLGFSPSIKWLNDIKINNKKVCGILAEAVKNQVVLGIGLNVCKESFDESLKDIACSLYDKYDLSLIKKTETLLIENLFKVLTLDNNAVFDYYKAHLSTLNKEITVYQWPNSYPAFALDLTEDYHLVVKKDDQIIELSTGEVSIRDR